MKKIILCFAVFSILLGCSVRKGTTGSNDDNIFYTQKGGGVRIEIDSNPTTGYAWVLTNESDLKNVNLIENGFVPYENKKGYVGSGGKQYFAFKVKDDAYGMDVVKFGYSRVWENLPPIEEKTFEIIVR